MISKHIKKSFLFVLVCTALLSSNVLAFGLNGRGPQDDGNNDQDIKHEISFNTVQTNLAAEATGLVPANKVLDFFRAMEEFRLDAFTGLTESACRDFFDEDDSILSQYIATLLGFRMAEYPCGSDSCAYIDQLMEDPNYSQTLTNALISFGSTVVVSSTPQVEFKVFKEADLFNNFVINSINHQAYAGYEITLDNLMWSAILRYRFTVNFHEGSQLQGDILINIYPEQIGGQEAQMAFISKTPQLKTGQVFLNTDDVLEPYLYHFNGGRFSTIFTLENLSFKKNGETWVRMPEAIESYGDIFRGSSVWDCDFVVNSEESHIANFTKTNEFNDELDSWFRQALKSELPNEHILDAMANPYLKRIDTNNQDFEVYTTPHGEAQQQQELLNLHL